MRLSATKLGSIANSRSFGDQLFDLAGQVPNLDLNFAGTKTLDPRVTFTRASTGTYVGSDGLIKSATTDEARFDHNPTTGESLGLLVEEARTNLLLRSEEFNTTWTKAAVSVTDNQRVAPNGTTTMDTVTLTGGSGYLQQAITSVSTTVYTQSIYVFSASNRMRLIAHNGTADICNITWTSVSSNTNTVTGTATSITSTLVGSGIYRLTFSFTASSSTINIRLQPLDSSGAAVVGATADFWGAQLETGAFATSYIPTTTATVTRAADVASITGTNFSSWYNQTEGTVFAEYKRLTNFSAGRICLFSDTTANEQMRINGSVSTNIRPDWQVIDGGSVVANVLGAVEIAVGASGKTAGTYKLNDFQQATNSSLGTADTAGTLPTLTVLNIGANETGSGSMINGTIKRLTYWPVRLANPTLQSITAP
jgi:hypothetical protein